MAGGSSIEDDVVVLCCRSSISQQFRKFIESRYFDCVCAGKLLLDAIHCRLRKKLAIRPNNAFAVKTSDLFRVNVHGVQPRQSADRSRPYAEMCFQDFVKIGSRVGTDQEDSFAPSTSETAMAQATDVFPTPPFPVKSRFRVGARGMFMAQLPPDLSAAPILTKVCGALVSVIAGPGSNSICASFASSSRVG